MSNLQLPVATVASYVDIAKDMIVAIAAIVTAVVAVVGLQRWRYELRGKAHFEAARNLIRDAYRLRDALRGGRSYLVHAAEFPASYPPQRPTDRTEAEAWAHVYTNRFTPVREALQNFEARALEAEALWGASVRNPVERLRGCVITLRTAMEADTDDKLSGGQQFRHDPDFGRRIREDLQQNPSEANNRLSREIAGALSDLEDQLRIHLER